MDDWLLEVCVQLEWLVINFSPTLHIIQKKGTYCYSLLLILELCYEENFMNNKYAGWVNAVL